MCAPVLEDCRPGSKLNGSRNSCEGGTFMVPAPPVISLEPFVNRAVSIGVQSVLFNNKIEHLRRAIASLARSAELGISAGLLTGVTLHLGDCSSMACLSHQ